MICDMNHRNVRLLALTCALLITAAAMIASSFVAKNWSVHSIDAVDEQIDVLLQSDAYVYADFEQKKELANELLLHLQQEKLISHCTYSEENSLFSFEYADHSLGGISLVDFTDRGINAAAFDSEKY